MDTWDAITSRRQVRSFTSDPISEQDLERILEAGRRAPSSRNRQPWDFVLVTDPDQIERLSQTWPGASWIPGSAATIALMIPKTEGREAVRDGFDLGMATIQIMIAATGLGIASGQASCGDQELAREVLGFPEDRQCHMFIALGYAADRPLRPIKTPARRDLEDVAHHGTW